VPSEIKSQHFASAYVGWGQFSLARDTEQRVLGVNLAIKQVANTDVAGWQDTEHLRESKTLFS